MNKDQQKRNQQRSRAKRTRSKLTHSDRPRLSIFRSGRHIYAQVIQGGKTIVSASDLQKKGAKAKKGTPLEVSAEVGKMIAEKALGKNISEVAFDRGGYQYHGRVKALAEAARKAGLKF